ncbi:hypothetical protein XENOCAPTIV_029180, partial [Xenoophorus captivus]
IIPNTLSLQLSNEIHPSIHFLYTLLRIGLRSSCRLSPVIYSQEAGYTLARLPVHHNTGQTNMHTPTHT